MLSSAALKAPKAGVSSLRWGKLKKKLLVYHPEDLPGKAMELPQWNGNGHT